MFLMFKNSEKCVSIVCSGPQSPCSDRVRMHAGTQALRALVCTFGIKGDASSDRLYGAQDDVFGRVVAQRIVVGLRMEEFPSRGPPPGRGGIEANKSFRKRLHIILTAFRRELWPSPQGLRAPACT